MHGTVKPICSAANQMHGLVDPMSSAADPKCQTPPLYAKKQVDFKWIFRWFYAFWEPFFVEKIDKVRFFLISIPPPLFPKKAKPH